MKIYYDSYYVPVRNEDGEEVLDADDEAAVGDGDQIEVDLTDGHGSGVRRRSRNNGFGDPDLVLDNNVIGLPLLPSR